MDAKPIIHPRKASCHRRVNYRHYYAEHGAPFNLCLSAFSPALGALLKIQFAMLAARRHTANE
jgi:hypothetical protein